MKLFVGNLHFSVDGSDLENIFRDIGISPLNAYIVNDKETGHSRGYGFVEIASEEDGHRAISELNGKFFRGRRMTVNIANPPKARGESRPERSRFRPPVSRW